MAQTRKKKTATVDYSFNQLVDTRPKAIVTTLLALIATYGLASWAIDSGSLWHYLFTIISLVVAVKAARKALKLT